MFYFITTIFALLTILMYGRREEYITKPLASAGFVGLALSMGALESAYGIAILSALALSFVGDVFLIPKTRKTFAVGLFSFLLAHIGFVVAFAILGFRWADVSIFGACVGVFSGLISIWLSPYLKDAFVTVHIYLAAISAMVALGLSAACYHYSNAIYIGVIMFYLSDIFVARNAFVKKSRINQGIGLPLYYAAQMLLAYSVTI